LTQKFNEKLLKTANVAFSTVYFGEARPAKSILTALEKTSNSTTKPPNHQTTMKSKNSRYITSFLALEKGSVPRIDAFLKI